MRGVFRLIFCNGGEIKKGRNGRRKEGRKD